MVDDDVGDKEHEKIVDKYLVDCKGPRPAHERAEYEAEHEEELSSPPRDAEEASNRSRRQAKYHGKCLILCHLPPGNPGNAHELRIPATAARAHLTHHVRLGDNNEVIKDYLGPCK